MRALLFALCSVFVSAPALAQSSTLAPQPADAPNDYSYAPSAGDTPPPAVKVKPTHPRRIGSEWIFRVGAYFGSGSATTDCQGDLCSGQQLSESYAEQAAPTFAIDWLANASPNFRFGFGLALMPGMKVHLANESFELGTDFSTDFVLEGVARLTKRTALTVRGSFGFSMLFPSGDLKRAADANEDRCADYNIDTYGSGDCEADSGVFLGGHAALGVGVLQTMGRYGLRLDVQVQPYLYRTLGLRVEGSESALNFSGVRPMMLIGIEL